MSHIKLKTNGDKEELCNQVKEIIIGYRVTVFCRAKN